MIATEPRRLRRALTTAVLTVLVVPLGACTFHDTDQVYTPAQGVNSRESTVDVLNAMIISSEDGEGRFVAGLSNGDESQGDQLSAMSGTGEDSSVQVELEGDPIELQPGGFVQIADLGSSPEGTQIIVSGEDVVPGEFIRLSLQFRNAEPIEMHVIVVGPDADLGPFASEAASPSLAPASPAESPAESPAGGFESPADNATEDE